MKLNYKILSSRIKVIIFFLLITFIAYLPFTSFLFALKNDAFTGYFPPKFFMSESIHAGYLPLWNPYINYGLPQYGDMSSGFWSPITWLIASTIGYNAYSFTLEEAFYIFIAGLGMYQLTSYWRLKNNTRLITGVAYMCCGYMVGHLQHFNWISGAAFLPWILFTYLEVLNIFNWRNLLKFAVTFSLFFTSAHPGLIIGAIYFGCCITIAILFHKIQSAQNTISIIKNFLVQHLFILLSALLFIIGPICGYLEVLPYISRGDKLPIDAIGEPATLKSYLSLLLPLGITKNDTFFATDISMRNCYVGLFPLLFFFSGVFEKKTKWQNLCLFIAGFFFLLSLGGIFKNISYGYLPLIGYVRLSGEFRIFTIFAMLIFSAIQFDKINEIEGLPKLKFYWYTLLSILGGIFLYASYNIAIANQSVFFTEFKWHDRWRLSIKQLMDHLTFYDTLLIQSSVQIFFLSIIYYALRKKRNTLFLYTIAGEIIFAALLNIPFTGVGKASVSDIQSLLNESPEGIPIPLQQTTNQNKTIAPDKTKQIGDWSFYSKQIGATQQVPYPINLSNSVLFYNSSDLKKINSMEFIFFSNPDPNNRVEITRFTPNCIKTDIYSSSNQIMTIKQNEYVRWSSLVNDTPVHIQLTENTFMSVPVEKGNQKISFRFENIKIKILICWTLFTSIIGFIFILCVKRKTQQ